MLKQIPRRTFLGGIGAAVAGSMVASGSATASKHDRRREETEGNTSVRGTDDASLRACAFNIRYDNPDDEPPWPDRRSRIVETIDEVEPDLLGVQEAQPHQYDFLASEVEDYEWYGVGRADGEREGEMVPVAWRRDRFEAVETGEFWLSETPAEPSVGWDADLPRVTTWARLQGSESGRHLWFCNTHFSHVSSLARTNSAEVLADRTRARADDGDDVIVVGDFNSKPSRDPYKVITGTGDRPDSPLVDPRREADTASVSGPWGTFHGFTGEVDDRIDYVFTQDRASVQSYRTLGVQDGSYRSDHLPVVAEVALSDHSRGTGNRGGWWD